MCKIHDLARSRRASVLSRQVPVRMPHHTVSDAGLLGGGNPPRPGEVSLAHRGLLFLDELPEFRRSCLEGMREPLEEGEMRLARAHYSLCFPARFQLMATMNPCPCGYLGHPERECVDSAAAIARYQQRLSGPLLDRFDLIVPITPETKVPLSKRQEGEPSASIRERVLRARMRQRKRLEGTGWRCNAEVPATGRALERYLPLDCEAERLFESVVSRRLLSPRAQHRIRRVAATLQDLGDVPSPSDPTIGAQAMAQALQLRREPQGSK